MAVGFTGKVAGVAARAAGRESDPVPGRPIIPVPVPIRRRRDGVSMFVDTPYRVRGRGFRGTGQEPRRRKYVSVVDGGTDVTMGTFILPAPMIFLEGRLEVDQEDVGEGEAGVQALVPRVVA